MEALFSNNNNSNILAVLEALRSILEGNTGGQIVNTQPQQGLQGLLSNNLAGLGANMAPPILPEETKKESPPQAPQATIPNQAETKQQAPQQMAQPQTPKKQQQPQQATPQPQQMDMSSLAPLLLFALLMRAVGQKPQIQPTPNIGKISGAV